MAVLNPTNGQQAVLNPNTGKYVIISPVTPKTASANAVSNDPTGSGLTVLGWIVLVIALYGVNHTNTGHEIIFLAMCLIVLFLFTANYKKIQSLLFKGGSTS